MLIDGTQIGSDSADYHNGSGANWTIGCHPDGDQTLNGDIPEFILYNRVLTATEADMVGAYLTDKSWIKAPPSGSNTDFGVAAPASRS